MAEIDITKVIDSGADTTKVYHKIVDEDPGDTSTAFASTDIVAYLQDISGMGAQRETSEYRLYHRQDAVKAIKGSTLNDISFTEALTKDALDALKEAYANKSYIVTGIFSKDGDFLGGYFGQISQWGMELPDNDVAKLTYTMSVSSEVDCTEPSA